MAESDNGRQQTWTRALWIWLAAAAIAGGVATARVLATGRAEPNLVLGWALTLICAALAVAAWQLLRRPQRSGLAAVLGWVLSYHALLGPIAMTELAIDLTSRNDHLAVRLYPHVVDFINSFE